MKSCPRCGKSYPDSETFCEADGTALTIGPAGGGRATTVMTGAEAVGSEGVECPVCGGKAQPGEVICNFCGTRLAPDPSGSESISPSRAGAQTRANPEAFVPASERIRSQPLPPANEDEEVSTGRSILSLLGFTLAAVAALGAGVWLAIYLSGRHQAPPIAQSSPAPAAISSPSVTLARNIAIQITGDMAGVMQRDAKSMAKVFEDNRAGLDSVYADARTSSPTLSDGMIMRLHVTADGTVSDGSVLISTAPNPSLDAAAVKAAGGWKFAPASGTGVDATYPLIFAGSDADAAAIESDLSAKFASLAPNTTPEYALSPAIAPSPAEAAATPAAAPSPPEAASIPPPVVAPAPRPVHHKPVVHKPPPLIERVNDTLRADRKLRRVQAYTSGGNVTIFGKVFNDDDRSLAEQTVRGISGVTSVTNNLTTDTADWARNATIINQQLQAAGLTGVTVKVIGSRAYLSGQVKTDLEKDRAVTITQSAAPVVVGTNLIRVVPPGLF
ncbi:MAG TPA: TonB family protein [Candidatus Binataceae bacterium]|nr:TonB family protein [Candidatus Binataceae bacterium]